MKLSRGPSSRGAKHRARGVWGGSVPSPRMGVRGCHPRENFEIWDAIWCNLVHFGKKFTFLQLSTLVNEYIVIVLDSGIDIVTYNFNFYPRDAMLALVMVIATCPSVRLSVTRRYCVKTKKASGMIPSPSGSPKTLVLWRQISSPNSKGFPRKGPQTRVGRKNSAIFYL